MDNNLVQQRIFVDDDYIVRESYSEYDSLVSELNRAPKISFEDYFGRLGVVTQIQNHFEKIHNVLAIKINQTIDDKTRDTIRREFEEIEAISEKHFNVESVTLNLITNHNTISSVPISAGKIDLSKYEHYGDKEAMDEYGKIIVDKNGVRFLHREAHHIIMTIGVGVLAASQLTSSHVTALFFHEIGHSFMQYKTGWNIGTQRLIYYADTAVRLGFTFFQLGSSVYESLHNKVIKTGYDQAKTISQKFKKTLDHEKKFGMKIGTFDDGWTMVLSKITMFGPTIKEAFAELGKRAITIVFCIQSIVQLISDLWGYTFNNSKSISNEMKSTRDKMLDGSFVIGKPEDLTLMVQTCSRQFVQVLSCGFTIYIFGLPTFVIQKMIRSFLFPGNWTGRKVEYSADEIAMSYGLGPEVAEALKKFRDVNINNDIATGGFYKYTNSIPVLNVVLQMPMLLLISSENFATGHPSDRSRINNLYNQLLKELNAKTINPKLRKALVEDLNRVANTYNEYIDPKLNAEENNHARGFVYFVGRFIHSLFRPDGSVEKKPPNKIILRLQAIKTWMQSADIKKLFGMKGSEEKYFLNSLDGTAAMESEDLLEPSFLDDELEITYESYFSEDVYAVVNSVVMESYVGKKKIVENSIEHIKEIRALLPKSDGRIPSESKDKILSILAIWSKEISTEFNVEDTCFGLENIYNAFAVPLFCGNSVQFKSANEVKIIESSQGFKFEKKDNLHFIIVLGLRFLTDPKLSDETIVSILFHEIGHGFQQYKNESLKKQKNDTVIFNMVGLFKDFIYALGTFQILNAVKYAFSITQNVFVKFGIGKDRANAKQEIVSTTTDTLANTEFKDGNVVKQSNNNVVNPITAVILGFQAILGFIVSAIPIPGIASFLRVIVYDPLFLLDLAVRGMYFSRQKRNEYFADSFASAYGLGVSLSELSYNLYEMNNEDLCKIPLVKIAVQFNVLGSISMIMALDDHPTHQQRIRATYEYLEKELLTNKTLTPALRKDLLEDLSQIRKLYNDMTSPVENFKNGRIGQGLLWFCVGIFVKLKSSAKNASDIMTPIIANKLQVLKTGFSVFSEKKKIQETLSGNVELAKAVVDEYSKT
jgi:Zn-dependent protease with chaperone function